MTALRAWIALVKVTFRRQLRSKKMLLCVLLLVLVLLVVLIAGSLVGWTPRSFGQEVVLRLHALFFVPAICLLFGTAALGDDREEKTLAYLLSRPIPRTAAYVAKLVAVLPLALGFSVGGLWLSRWVASLHGGAELDDLFVRFVPAILAGALAYVSLFHLLGALFRHSTLIAIAYVFFVEVFFIGVPGIVKRLSLCYYTWSMAYEAGEPLGLQPSARAIFVPLSAGVAATVLGAVAFGCLLLGALLFARSERGLSHE